MELYSDFCYAGNGEDDSGDEEEGSDHENASDNINIGEVQQNGAMNGWQM